MEKVELRKGKSQADLILRINRWERTLEFVHIIPSRCCTVVPSKVIPTEQVSIIILNSCSIICWFLSATKLVRVFPENSTLTVEKAAFACAVKGFGLT